MRDPYADPRLNDVEKAVYGEVYTLIKEINDRLGERIELVLMVNLARRLVSIGMEPADIIEEIRSHAEKQQAWNRDSERFTPSWH